VVEKVKNGSDANQADDKDGADKEAENELVVVETDDNGKPINQAADAEADEAGADASGEVDEDERVGHSESDDEVEGETVEERRARRKKERQARNAKRRGTGQAKDKLIEQLQADRQVMMERIAAIEGRNFNYDVTGLSDKLAQINSQLLQAKDTMSTCVKAGDGDGVAEVTEIQYQLRDQKRQIEFALQRAEQQRRQGQEHSAQETQAAQGGQVSGAQISPTVITQAVAFAQKLKWYDPKGKDQDSLIVQAIDNAVTEEGFNPETTEYWEELEDRVRDQLPHRFKTRAKPNQEADTTTTVRSSGPRMASSSGTANGNGRRLGRNEVYVSPERKAAMVAAGAWEDPKKRARLLARYAEADRESAAARH
jgi:hypothetical protein